MRNASSVLKVLQMYFPFKCLDYNLLQMYLHFKCMDYKLIIGRAPSAIDQSDYFTQFCDS